jgi:hypothetical protein
MYDLSDRRTALAISLATLQLKLYALADTLERRYSPDQPRVSAGNPDGGQWIGGAGGEALQRDRRAPLRVALAARLVGQRIGFGDDRVIRHCYYQDMLGRPMTVEQDAIELCPPTRPAPPTKGQ